MIKNMIINEKQQEENTKSRQFAVKSERLLDWIKKLAFREIFQVADSITDNLIYKFSVDDKNYYLKGNRYKCYLFAGEAAVACLTNSSKIENPSIEFMLNYSPLWNYFVNSCELEGE